MMRKHFAIALFGTLLVCSLVVFSPATSAGHLGQIQTVDGVAIYLGVVPAAVLRQHLGNYPVHEVSKIPSGKCDHQVMLALFDDPGGERITNAVVTVRIAALAIAGPTKPLDPMVVAGTLTDCNYFRIWPSHTTVIPAEIRRPDTTRVIQARFFLEGHVE